MAGRKRRRIATGKTLWKWWWWWWWWRWQGWQYNDSGTLLQATATRAATPRSDYRGEAAAAAAIGPLQVRRRRQHILVCSFLGIGLPVLQFSLKLHTQRCNQKTQRGCLRTAFKRASDILVSSLFPPWRCSWSRGGCRIPKLFRHLLARQCRHSTIQPFHFFALHVSASLCTGTSWLARLWGEFLRREGTPPGLKPTVALSSSQYAEAFSNKLEFSLMRQFYP